MSKKQTNYLKYEDLKSIVVQMGFQNEEQAGFLKVFGPDGIYVYVARTKAVSRIDLSHFTVDPSEFGAIDLGDAKFGGILQQMDFTLSHEDIAGNFVKVLNHMRTLKPLAKAEKKGKDKTGKAKATGVIDIAAILARTGLPAAKAKDVLEEAKDQGMTAKTDDELEMEELERQTAPEGEAEDEDDAILDRMEQGRRGTSDAHSA